ncbi:restriction endonuclease subunit S [Lysobacter xinjiangensis]|uniref:Restriction endonuclease subunit S n=1 Tax=Cognatilysobacter xinjiangensis TaxID=546892 RepID=A0ABQ3C1J2_9GAMM|nr:restriction endonuclease subunit S [Lysobacter xinjiangensis]GGZ63820.1 restriction endonuclease subunit S [Lysobacter xinjiangensis]
MAKQGAKTATPRLRFPEFRKSAPWPETDLGAVLFEHGTKDDGASEVHSVSVHKGVVNQMEHLGRSFAAADRSKYNLVKPYDVVYTKSPTGDFPFGIVKQSRLPINAIVSPLYGVFSPSNRYVGYLLDAYFESPNRTNLYLAPVTQKGAKNTIQISNDGFLSKGIFLPEQEGEQQKIADCLTSLDEVIAAQGRKVEALKAHKRGLMQQLFPREGETRPRLRFSEFRDAPKWSLGKASDIVEVIQGYGFPERLQGNATGEFPFYKVSDISACVDAGGVLLTDANNHIEADVLAELRAKPMPVGATVFAKIGEAIRSNKRAMTARPSLVDNNAAGVKGIDDRADDRFVYYLWSQVSLIEYAGGVVPAVNKSAIEQIPVCYPKKDEQQRIADCLASLDTRIAAEAARLAALKTHKQGLMQQLFPAPEATGA